MFAILLRPISDSSQDRFRHYFRAAAAVAIVWLATGLMDWQSGARADGENAAANSKPGAGDVLERSGRRHAAADRVEELDQQAWKAISKDGDIDQAILSMAEAAELAATEFGKEHWLCISKTSLAAGMKSLKDLPPDSRQVIIDAARSQAAATFQWSQGHREKALGQMRLVHEKRQRILGKEHILTAHSLLGLGYHECGFAQYRDAEEHLLKVVDLLRSAWGGQSPGCATALFYLAAAEVGLKDFEPAEQHLRQAIEILQPVAGDGSFDFFLMMHADAQVHLARLLNDLDRFDESEPFARRGAAVMAFFPSAAYGKYLESQIETARSLSGQGKPIEAEILFKCLIKSVPPHSPPEGGAMILRRYAEHFRRLHRDADAEGLEKRIKALLAQNRQQQPADGLPVERPALSDQPNATRKK